jgi:hypothetical protein
VVEDEAAVTALVVGEAADQSGLDRALLPASRCAAR